MGDGNGLAFGFDAGTFAICVTLCSSLLSPLHQARSLALDMLG